MLSALRRDRRGVAATEFAVLAPVMILLITATVEAAHIQMVQTSLEGAVATAARESVARMSLSDDERDTLMRERISTLMSSIPVASGRSLEISTQAYRTMGSAYPEAFEDANGNEVYDEGELFTDRNHNGVRDVATPVAGKMGDVGDVVAYQVTYPVALYFPFLSPIFGETRDITTATVARNEPERSGSGPPP